MTDPPPTEAQAKILAEMSDTELANVLFGAVTMEMRRQGQMHHLREPTEAQRAPFLADASFWGTVRRRANAEIDRRQANKPTNHGNPTP